MSSIKNHHFIFVQVLWGIAFILFGLSLGACTRTLPVSESKNRIDEFAREIVALSAEISVVEADQTSNVLINTALELADEYNMASPPRFHNLLVNTGVRKRGLCCHWAEDLHAELRQLNVDSLKFDWLVSRQGNPFREHTSIVVYPANTSWKQGIVFDPWRKSGIPYWTAVQGDEYPWISHPLNGRWDKLRCK